MDDKIKYIKPVEKMNESEINRRKKRNKGKGKKKNSKGRVVFIVILCILVLFIAGAWWFIGSKLNMIQGDKLNENDLGINDKIYDEVADTVSKEQFDSVTTIALFGVDGGRSDTIMVASINKTKKTAKIISIPRDTYVDIPGRGKDKINHAYAYGKEQLAIKTINSNFGLNIKEYITVDFNGLMSIVNKLGGITIEISEVERKYINEFSHESYAITKRSVKTITKSGTVTLDGEQALTHARNRTVGNDFTRAERQRDVINAIISKASNMDFAKMLDVANGMTYDVKTNINVPSYIPLATEMFADKDKYLRNILSVQVPDNSYSSGQMIGGVYYFTTDYEKAKQDFLKYIYEQ